MLTPREVYRIDRQSMSEGEIVNERAFWVAYNLSQPDDSPIIWPEPNPEEKGDSR